MHLIADLPQVSEAQSVTLAAQMAPLLMEGDLIALDGDLGAGKSTFARALIRAAMGDAEAEVPSPTFTLMQDYLPPKGPKLVHGDMYRLTDPEEAFDLGLEDAREEAALLIEWPSNLPLGMLKGALWLKFEMADEGLRRLRVAGPEGWMVRLNNGDWPNLEKTA